MWLRHIVWSLMRRRAQPRLFLDTSGQIAKDWRCQMTFNRVRMSKGATTRLQMLKGKTGLTPNILLRIAVCYSLNEPRIPNPKMFDEEGQELNRYTLTGEWDCFYMGLLRE